jgi:hypothetical protein
MQSFRRSRMQKCGHVLNLCVSEWQRRHAFVRPPLAYHLAYLLALDVVRHKR